MLNISQLSTKYRIKKMEGIQVGFRIFMLIVVLLIPFTMLFFGWLLFRRTSKEINYVYGYRTKRSMRNEETWKFANQYFGKLWYLCGLLSVPLSVMAIALVLVKQKGVGYRYFEYDDPKYKEFYNTRK